MAIVTYNHRVESIQEVSHETKTFFLSAYVNTSMLQLQLKSLKQFSIVFFYNRFSLDRIGGSHYYIYF